MATRAVCVDLYIGYTERTVSDRFRQAHDETLEQFFERVKCVAEMRQREAR